MNKTDRKKEDKIESSKENGKEKSKEKSEDKDEFDKNLKAKYGLKTAEIASNFFGKVLDRIYFTKKDKEKNLEETNEYLKKKIEEFLEIKIEEFLEYIKKSQDKKGQENQFINEANKEWNEAKNKIIETMFSNMDLSLIKQKLIKENTLSYIMTKTTSL